MTKEEISTYLELVEESFIHPDPGTMQRVGAQIKRETALRGSTPKDAAIMLLASIANSQDRQRPFQLRTARGLLESLFLIKMNTDQIATAITGVSFSSSKPSATD